MNGNTHEMMQRVFLKDCSEGQLLSSFVPSPDSMGIKFICMNNWDLHITIEVSLVDELRVRFEVAEEKYSDEEMYQDHVKRSDTGSLTKLALIQVNES